MRVTWVKRLEQTPLQSALDMPRYEFHRVWNASPPADPIGIEAQRRSNIQDLGGREEIGTLLVVFKLFILQNCLKSNGGGGFFGICAFRRLFSSNR